MPTFNQLVRKGRQTSAKKSTAPALQKGYNSLQKKASSVVHLIQQVLLTENRLAPSTALRDQKTKSN